jgi:hypothetical protein
MIHRGYANMSQYLVTALPVYSASLVLLDNGHSVVGVDNPKTMPTMCASNALAAEPADRAGGLHFPRAIFLTAMPWLG